MANRAQENQALELKENPKELSDGNRVEVVPFSAIDIDGELRMGEEFRIEEITRGETPNGIPYTVLETGEEVEVCDGATVSRGLYVCAPDELVAAQFEPPIEQKTNYTRIALAAMLAAGAMGGAVTGCANTFDAQNSGAGAKAPEVEQTSRKMNNASDIDDLSQLVEACHTQPGHVRGNWGTVNGNPVYTYIDEADAHCYYISAATAQSTIEGECASRLLDLPGVLQPGDPGIGSCPISRNNGDEIYYKRGMETNIEADVIDNAGDLVVQNPRLLSPAHSAFYTTWVEDGGNRYLLSDNGTHVEKYNIDTGQVEVTTVPTDCGLPSKDPDTGVWVGSRFDNYTGPIQCRIVKANSLAGLATSIQYVNNIMNNGGLTGDAINPRIMGNIMTVEGRMNNGGTLDPPKTYYAIVLCGDGTCTGIEDATNCPADCATPICDNDGTCDPGEDDVNCPADCPLVQNDAGVDGAVQADSAVDGEVTTPDAATDAEPQTDADTPDPDSGTDAGTTIPPECVPFVDKIDIVSGAENCDLVDCESNQNYEYATIEGQCTFEVQLGNPNPVQLTIDGAYSVDFLNKIGELLRGSYEVEDRGNEMGTTYANSVTGVTGTTYGGNETTMENGNQGYHLYCDEGQVQLRINDKLVATLNAGDSGTWDLENIVTEQPDKKCSTGGPGGKELALAGMLLFLAAGALRKRREEQTVEVPGSALYRLIRDRISKNSQ